ncbi:DMT family transporter [Paenibacillus cineris]|uniref:DMT family transporter n=1 Tax=Paenibacillus cineris TaxID=237530 RepID=UPI001BB43920|nr:DMT family transporter [Paenibacillus cineris]
MTARNQALIGLTGVAILWGISYVISAYLLNKFSPLCLSFVRMTLTWAWILIFLGRKQQQGRRPKRREWLLLIASAIFGTLIQQPLYFVGLRLSTAANASLIYAAAPLLAVLMERLTFRSPVTAAKMGGSILGFGGVAIIIILGGGEIRMSVGDLLLVIAVLGLTTGMMVTPVLARTLSFRDMNIYSGGLGLILLAPMAGWELGFGDFMLAGGLDAWLLIIILSLITSVSGIWFTKGVALTGPGTAAMFMNLPPIISMITGHLFLGDPVYPGQLWGGTFVIIGVILSNFQSRTKRNTKGEKGKKVPL